MVALSMGSPFEIGFMENARLVGLAIVSVPPATGRPKPSSRMQKPSIL
jgi:hypothetical protein